MVRPLLVSAALLVLGPLGSSALGEEQTLKFRLVTHQVSGEWLEFAAARGHGVNAGNSIGVAVFEDGRIAFKDYVFASDGGDDEGTYSGYSTYTFQNGDSLTLRFTGGWSAAGDGGDYEVLSGTGAYKGATGTGRYDAVDEFWEKSELFEGWIKVALPSG